MVSNSGSPGIPVGIKITEKSRLRKLTPDAILKHIRSVTVPVGGGDIKVSVFQYGIIVKIVSERISNPNC
jgi:hypothetical protein